MPIAVLRSGTFGIPLPFAANTLTGPRARRLGGPSPRPSLLRTAPSSVFEALPTAQLFSLIRCTLLFFSLSFFSLFLEPSFACLLACAHYVLRAFTLFVGH